jgi:hypothetical protein
MEFVMPRLDTSTTGQFRIVLPPDVMAEIRRPRAGVSNPMAVDGLKPTILSRLFKVFSPRQTA